ncbi:MAG: hypothetical protein QM793_01620 [Muricomes sp.]
MKRFLELLGKGLLVASSMILLTTQTAFAEGTADDSYTYTVTFYAGNQGSFQGTGNIQVHSAGASVSGDGNQIQVTGLKYGDEIIVDAAGTDMVSLADNDKYYVKGIRKSGRDNNTVGTQRFLVEADTEYVVAYGIKGNMVAYTVNYQDANGNTLMASRTYYGNVGDKPVVAYQYIENYQPQAYNLTKTLSQNGAENVFTFTYSQVTAPAAPANPTTPGTPTVPGTTGTTTTPANPGTTTPGGTTGGTTTGGTTTPGGTTTEPNEGVTITPEQTPQDLIELDDQEVPKSNITEETARDAEKASKRNYTVVYIIVAAAALAALTTLFVVLRKKKKI